MSFPLSAPSWAVCTGQTACARCGSNHVGHAAARVSIEAVTFNDHARLISHLLKPEGLDGLQVEAESDGQPSIATWPPSARPVSMLPGLPSVLGKVGLLVLGQTDRLPEQQECRAQFRPGLRFI
jgi:hypothetical protein